METNEQLRLLALIAEGLGAKSMSGYEPPEISDLLEDIEDRPAADSAEERRAQIFAVAAAFGEATEV